jgi:nucleolar protein 15
MSSQSVAEIVADTMNNYLLMGHLLKCQVGYTQSSCSVKRYTNDQLIPQDQVHPKLWEGANKKFRALPRARLEKERQEKVRMTPCTEVVTSLI